MTIKYRISTFSFVIIFPFIRTPSILSFLAMQIPHTHVFRSSYSVIIPSCTPGRRSAKIYFQKNTRCQVVKSSKRVSACVFTLIIRSTILAVIDGVAKEKTSILIKSNGNAYRTSYVCATRVFALFLESFRELCLPPVCHAV